MDYWNELANNLNWFKPSSPPQLLPKDILKGSRMISGEEAENQILNAITRPSFYSHSTNSQQWMQLNAMGGTTATASQIAWSNNMFTSYATTATSWIA